MTDSRTDDPGRKPEPEAGHDHDDDSLFERMVPENLKRRIEAGVDSVLRDRRVKHFVEEFKLPRELINHAQAQMDETKRAVVEIIARETREFLEQTNLADELARLLTQVTLQVDVRFIPNDKAVVHKPGADRKGGLFARFRSSPPPAPAKEPEESEDKPSESEEETSSS